MAISEREYAELIDYTLNKLREINASNVVEEINELIRRGTISIINDPRDLILKNIKESEVGKTRTRPLTSREAFEKIIDYLKKIIVDFPNYQAQIQKMFGPEVTWEYDQSASLESRESLPGFSASHIFLNGENINQAAAEFNNLNNYLKG